MKVNITEKLWKEIESLFEKKGEGETEGKCASNIRRNIIRTENGDTMEIFA